MWIRPAEALKQLAVSKARLVVLIKAGILVRPTIIGDGKVGWLQSEIDAAKKAIN